MTDTFIPTVDEGCHWSPETTIEAALAQWSTRGRIIEALDAPRDVLVRFYVNNGWDPTGWYVRSAQRVNIRTKSTKQARTWSYDALIFNASSEYQKAL